MAIHLECEVETAAGTAYADSEAQPESQRGSAAASEELGRAPSPVAGTRARSSRFVTVGTEPPSPPVRGSRRRIMTRQQGYALETIGHAVDYLNDRYIYHGPENEVLDFASPSIEAVHILVARQREILHGLPLAEPLGRRILKRLFRQARIERFSVIPSSSSGR